VSYAKTAVLIEMQFGMLNQVGPGNPILKLGSHWRHLANMTELSVCSGPMSNCFDPCCVDNCCTSCT